MTACGLQNFVYKNVEHYAIDKKTLELKEKTIWSTLSGNHTCAICLEAIDCTKTVYVPIQCSHAFCAECSEQIIKMTAPRLCPCCRTPIDAITRITFATNKNELGSRPAYKIQMKDSIKKREASIKKLECKAKTLKTRMETARIELQKVNDKIVTEKEILQFMLDSVTAHINTKTEIK